MKDNRRTWFLDFDGTIVYQKSYLSDEDHILPSTIEFFSSVVKKDDFVIITTGREEEHRDRIKEFMSSYGLKCDHIICGLPTGLRIVINDQKPDGTKTAHSLNVVRDEGITYFFEDM